MVRVPPAKALVPFAVWGMVLVVFGSYLLYVDHVLWVALLFWLSLTAWLVHELLLVPSGGAHNPSPEDRGSIRFLTNMKMLGLALGLSLAFAVNALSIRGARSIVVSSGVGLMWIGMALRRWAIHTLGRFFRRDVAIQESHRVIESGPYRVVRHPSYLGDLLTFAGIGLALTNWGSLAVVVTCPLLGYMRRMQVEEAALEVGLGDAYRAYEGRTRRLLPGIW